MSNLLLGTSGYSYSDWKGVFYPDELDKKELLTYYSSFFNTVEINFTYYIKPNPYIFKSMAEKVGDGFLFCVKAHSSVTHSRDCGKKDLQCFLDSLIPFMDSNKLGSILIQFPWEFKFSKPNMEYLKKLRGDFGDIELCIEFRHNSWICDEVFELLRSLKLGFCNVDQPDLNTLLPPTDINTTDTGYVRFHGRNAASWWKPGQAFMRYDYMYDENELSQWVPRIKKVSSNTKKTFVYFNNHYKAQAVKSARILQNLIKTGN